MAKVSEAKKTVSCAEQAIYTLGYEGLHFEDYVNKLIKKGVKLLCDVRRNPLSRKFGFTQRSLSNLLPKFDIEYLHLPELGIEAESRKHLDSKNDYKALFANYKKTLPSRRAGLDRIMEQLRKHKRIALTCFERNPQLCHRHCISDFLDRHNRITVRHL